MSSIKIEGVRINVSILSQSTQADTKHKVRQADHYDHAYELPFYQFYYIVSILKYLVV